MKKILFTIFVFLFCVFNINATEISNMYIHTEAEIAGALRVRQVIQVKNQTEDLDIDVLVKYDEAMEFDGSNDSFILSDIYNASDVQIYNVGILKDAEEFNVFEITEDELDSVDYELVDNGNYYNIIIKENDNKNNIYYVDYAITDVLVEHNDCVELYYRYLDKFKYDVDNIYMTAILAYSNSELYKTYAHGSSKFSVTVDKENQILNAKITNYKKGDYIDFRILFDKYMLMLNLNDEKKSNMDAIDIIKSVENSRTKDAKIQRGLLIALLASIILLFICIFIFLVLKYKPFGFTLEKKEKVKKQKVKKEKKHLDLKKYLNKKKKN